MKIAVASDSAVPLTQEILDQVSSWLAMPAENNPEWHAAPYECSFMYGLRYKKYNSRHKTTKARRFADKKFIAQMMGHAR